MLTHQTHYSKSNIKLQDDDEDVVISLCSKDPQACKGVVRFDYTKGEYVPLKLRWKFEILEYIMIISVQWMDDRSPGDWEHCSS